MVVGVHNSRAEAESAAGTLQVRGVPATVLEIREMREKKFVRIYQVLVPREYESAPELSAPQNPSLTR